MRISDWSSDVCSSDLAEGSPEAAVISGVEATERELLGVFERHGIARIDPKGQKFDPNLHQAMFEIEDPTVPSGTVVQVVAAGSVQHGRLLRAAMVGVSKGRPQDALQPGAAIGSGSSRERVCQYVWNPAVARSLKKKQKTTPHNT